MPTRIAMTTGDVSSVFIELGIAIVGLAMLARFASRWGFSSIPLYLMAGLSFGNGGLLPLPFSQEFVHVGSEIGVILLLFMLGLEYTGEELAASLRSGLPSGLIDFALNFPPGLVLGLLLGWSPLAAVLLGGVTYISSSGVIAKVLGELGRMDNPETPSILSVLVLEDMAMAVYLPLVSVLLIGHGALTGAISVLVALLTVSVVLFVAVRYGGRISRLVAHQSDEVFLLTTFGLVLLVGGIAQRLQVSAAVGAFLVGIALSSSGVAPDSSFGRRNRPPFQHADQSRKSQQNRSQQQQKSLPPAGGGAVFGSILFLGSAQKQERKKGHFSPNSHTVTASVPRPRQSLSPEGETRRPRPQPRIYSQDSQAGNSQRHAELSRQLRSRKRSLRMS